VVHAYLLVDVEYIESVKADLHFDSVEVHILYEERVNALSVTSVAIECRRPYLSSPSRESLEGENLLALPIVGHDFAIWEERAVSALAIQTHFDRAEAILTYDVALRRFFFILRARSGEVSDD